MSETHTVTVEINHEYRDGYGTVIGYEYTTPEGKRGRVVAPQDEPQPRVRTAYWLGREVERLDKLIELLEHRVAALESARTTEPVEPLF